MRVIFIFLTLLMYGCASQPEINNANEAVKLTKKESLNSAYRMILKGNYTGALDKHLKALATECEAEFSDSDETVYVSRSNTGTTYLLLTAGFKGVNAKVINTPCAKAFYYTGYANLEIGEINDGEKYIKKAVEMSPLNSYYLSELAYIYQLNKKFELALATFIKSEKLAQNFSPDKVKLDELSRAKRGTGSVLIDLGRLSEAKVKFQECLKLNPEDKSALGELKYIQSIE
ncbi:hypothetical protein [Motilimonas sp. E26]|uniref:tetratricopeptide repeat protein n=1 Tax=Motilimonas sp. E26 TaxID=2865674 RepID=UPI001E4967E0|nr:hypothetical protein [Motilimonas sp. E26]MCE0558921.1 hypothetical protein [Motilimonas sp. E26]